MPTPLKLTPSEIERFLFIIELGLEIRSRERFRNWSQGVLQGILPSKSMIFGLSRRGGGTASVDHVSSMPISQGTLRSMFDPESGLLTQALNAWSRGGYAPLVVRTRHGLVTEANPISMALDREGLQNIALHGTCPIDGYHSAFYGFLDIPDAALEKFPLALELLVPHLFTATARLLMEESTPRLPIPEMSGALLTARQQQVLKWICAGMSNFEIANVLQVSPLTVKNHVQNLFRRLKVQNRAQAVGKGLSLGIVSDHDHRQVL
jgi:transcriptional regulator EpsA